MDHKILFLQTFFLDITVHLLTVILKLPYIFPEPLFQGIFAPMITNIRIKIHLDAYLRTLKGLLKCKPNKKLTLNT